MWLVKSYKRNRLPILCLIAVGAITLCIFASKNELGTWSSNPPDLTIESNVEKYKPQCLRGGIDKVPRKDSSGEIECKRVLEKIFQKPFVKERFLQNKVTGQPLEIDCYNSELKIGCEYNGAQHYSYIPFMHSNKEAFRNQQYRDLMKKQLCEQEGIKLLVVPYTVSVGDIEQYIVDLLKKNNYIG